MSEISDAIDIADTAFRSNLDSLKLSPCAEEVVNRMMKVTIHHSMTNYPNPSDWWEDYKPYAIKHAGIIARVAKSLARTGELETLYANDLIAACDAVVKRAVRICPEHHGKLEVGCTNYSRAAITPSCAPDEPDCYEDFDTKCGDN